MAHRQASSLKPGDSALHPEFGLGVIGFTAEADLARGVVAFIRMTDSGWGASYPQIGSLSPSPPDRDCESIQRAIRRSQGRMSSNLQPALDLAQKYLENL